MPEVNIPLLRKAVEWAEAEAAKPPELCEWEQRAWVTPRSATDPNVRNAPWHAGITSTFRQAKAPECGTCYCVAGFIASQSGPVSAADAREIATVSLGLSREQAWALFEANNTAPDVRRIAEEIAGERL